MGDPGGGSDFAGFYNHLGIPIAEWGFGGAGGVYHSLYDSYHWMTKFGDTAYAYHAAAARIGAAMVLRIANADILPYDYEEYARTMRNYLPALDSALAKKGWATPDSALARGDRAAGEGGGGFRGAARLACSRAARSRRNRRRARTRRCCKVERALTRPEGLKTRPWFRNLIYVADENNGYANMVFPSVREALRSDDKALTEKEMADLASRFDAAARAVNDATAALR